jgi:ATP-dependent DNA helicase RecQ
MRSPEEVLKKYWGYDAFRPVQPEIVNDILNGKDVLALLPTGGGKSICFQVPALCMEGVCIVVSPLVALMNDQIKNLHERGVKALAVHSNLGKKEIDIALDKAIYEDYKLLYLSPERLQTKLFLERFKKMNVSFLAVDEAHCISQWGYDFRPPYLKINDLRKLKPDFGIAALTATATPQVVKDIQDKLGFKTYNVKQKSFKRSNLAYVVQKIENKDQKVQEIIRKVAGPGIIYCNTRKGTKTIANFLNQQNVSATFYHAGLEASEKERNAQQWFSGKKKIIAATNAFGMGIDKPDVRLVINYNVSASLEAYFQEAGRAGRDGKNSYAILLWNEADIDDLKSKLALQFPPVELIKNVYDSLAQQIGLSYEEETERPEPYDLQEIYTELKAMPYLVFSALKILELSGFIFLSDEPNAASTVKLLINQNEAYNLRLRETMSGKVIEILLRSYPGLFDFDVKISEQLVANQLGLTYNQVITLLTEMHQKNIIFYIQKTDKPKVSFPIGRLRPENLHLSKEAYEWRKERYTEMVNAVEKYVSTNECRSKQLLAYFGETESEKCGVCDVCLAEKRKVLEVEIKEFAKLLFQNHKGTETNYTELFTLYSQKPEKFILQALRFLSEHKLLKISGNKILFKK